MKAASLHILITMLFLFSRPIISAAGEAPANAITLIEKNDSASAQALMSMKSYDSNGRTGITAL